MKMNCRKKSPTLGEFIAAAHDAWGSRWAGGLVWLAANARLVAFQRPQRFASSGRNPNHLPF